MDEIGVGEWAPLSGRRVRFKPEPLLAQPPPPPKPPAPRESPATPAGAAAVVSWAARGASPAQPQSGAGLLPAPALGETARPGGAGCHGLRGPESIPNMAAVEELAQEVSSDLSSDMSNGESSFARPVVPWSECATGAGEHSGPLPQRSFRHVTLVLGAADVALGAHLVLPCSGALCRFLGAAAAARGLKDEEACPLVLGDERGTVIETSCQIRQMCRLCEPGSQRPCGQVGMVGGWFCIAKPSKPGAAGWGLLASIRRLQEGDSVLFTFSGDVLRGAGDGSPPMLCLKATRARLPAPLHILEPNVESELDPAARPHPFKYCRSSFPAAGFLKLHRCGKYWTTRPVQVSHRVRIVQSGGARGWGVMALEGIPAGTHVFSYCGEVLDRDTARRREGTYRSGAAGLVGGVAQGAHMKHCPHFLYDVIAPPDQSSGTPRTLSAVIDSTLQGNVARFVNHRCEDATLRAEVRLARTRKIVTPSRHRVNSITLPEILYLAKRDISSGEELTVDYLSGDRPNVLVDLLQLQKELRCTCTSPACRGWIF